MNPANTVKKFLDDTAKDLNDLKLTSDDHGHSCTELREYCEQELCRWADNEIPKLIALCRCFLEDVNTVSNCPPTSGGGGDVVKWKHFLQDTLSSAAEIVGKK